MSSDKKIARALLSVTDKTGLVDFAQCLARHKVELVSTGGTAKTLRDAGLTVREVADFTSFPEMFDGRVKTLHSKVHGGILYMRGNQAHRDQAAANRIEPIDMVVVNLYAFEKAAANPDARFAEIIENIDIGGPALIRSAAKNFEDVAVVTAPAEYGPLADELDLNRGLIDVYKRQPQDRGVRDLTSAVAWLEHRPDVDPRRIGAIGWCMGCLLYTSRCV